MIARFRALPHSPRPLAAVLLCAASLLPACENAPPKATFESLPAPAPAPSPVLAQDAWDFGPAPGIAITTLSYRIYTTAQGALPARLPSFLQASLAHYRTAFTPLPAPPQRLETFVLANRSQWSQCVQMIWAEQAEPYLTIQRGGVTAGAKSVLFDVGGRDTLVLAAHEGWHQYVQATFKDALPTWLDESLATYMEGFRTDPADFSRFTFLPWANTERFDRLRDAAAVGSLLTLREVIESGPRQQLAAASGNALTWYAQAWALSLWLWEADAGARRAGLQQLLSDAESGHLLARVEEKLGPRAAVNVRQKRPGPEVLFTYFPGDIDSMNQSYQAFIRRIVGTGSRDRIVAGLAPLDQP